ncbi:hypothetical protein WN944_010102 [Citrus x changshan-huyou]|uniref:Uncharacterized protein n=1 Tax=Citrus x changshan-huyou TaxID=2935761 RepID=A0AAP0MUA1_9ROSI
MALISYLRVIMPLAILDSGLFKCNNRLVTKLLVPWQGQSKKEATWEEYYEFVARFASFQLEDKLPSYKGRMLGS